MPEQKTAPNEQAGSIEQKWENVVEHFQESCSSQADDFYHFTEQVGEQVARYCRHRPQVVAIGLLALGFLVGWKMKP